MFKEECINLSNQLIEWRRDFHENPELSYREERTARVIASFLKELQLDVHENVFGFGLYADLKGAEEGPTIALRADMDALPIKEETELPYASTVENVMHACGHDGHMASLMGAAFVLTSMKERLKGTVRFIFQPAEELTPGGAIGMIEAGVLDNVHAIFGIHLWSELPSGTFRTTLGPMMAASDKFTIDIQGKGGHGAMPHKTVDALLIASQIVTSAQHIVSRQIDPIEAGVLTFGVLQSGTAFNVIADKAQLQGTARSFTETVRVQLQYKLEKTAETMAMLYNAKVDVMYERGYSAVINHEQEAKRLMEKAKNVFGEEKVDLMKPNMAGEDFAYYLEKVPGAFCFVGAGGNEQEVYPHHHPKFVIEENVLPQAVELFCEIVMDYLV
jgi:amidohydrolase